MALTAANFITMTTIDNVRRRKNYYLIKKYPYFEIFFFSPCTMHNMHLRRIEQLQEDVTRLREVENWFENHKLEQFQASF